MSILLVLGPWILEEQILFRNVRESPKKAAFLTRITESSAVKLITWSRVYLVHPAWEQVWVYVALEQQLGQLVKRLDVDRSSLLSRAFLSLIPDGLWTHQVTDSIDTNILGSVFESTNYYMIRCKCRKK